MLKIIITYTHYHYVSSYIHGYVIAFQNHCLYIATYLRISKTKILPCEYNKLKLFLINGFNSVVIPLFVLITLIVKLLYILYNICTYIQLYQGCSHTAVVKLVSSGSKQPVLLKTISTFFNPARTSLSNMYITESGAHTLQLYKLQYNTQPF